MFCACDIPFKYEQRRRGATEFFNLAALISIRSNLDDRHLNAKNLSGCAR